MIGAAIGAFAGSHLDPDVGELVPSLAVAGLGLGGLIGLLLLAPVGVCVPGAEGLAAAAEPASPAATDPRHMADPEPEAAPPARRVAPVREDTEPESTEVLEPAPGSSPTRPRTAARGGARLVPRPARWRSPVLGRGTPGPGTCGAAANAHASCAAAPEVARSSHEIAADLRREVGRFRR